MSLSQTPSNTLPSGPIVVRKLSQDDILMRGGMIVIALYLVITLVLPLYAMFSKSFSTYRMELGQYEIQVSDEAGQFSTSTFTLAERNEQLGVVPASDLSASSGDRLGATKFFPDFSFRSPIKYRIRNLEEGGRFLIGSTLKDDTTWHELDSNTFRRVQLRPVKSTGIENFVPFFVR